MTSTVAVDSNDVVHVTRVDSAGIGTKDAITVGTLMGSLGAGYSSGSAVTQATNRTTGVTINSYAGAITLHSEAGSTTPSSFTVTNSKVAATDTIILSQKSGTDKYDLSVTAVGSGSFEITLNTKSGTTSEAPVINFAVIKAAAA